MYHPSLISGKKIFNNFVSALLLFVLSFFNLFVLTPVQQANAQTSQEWTQTTQAEFDSGEKVNIDTASSPGDAKITSFDEITKNITVTNHPTYAAYNSLNNKVYVSHAREYDNKIYVIDGSTDTVIKIINISSPYSYGVTYNSQNNKIYVGNYDGTVSVIDCYTDSVISTVKVGGSTSWMELTYNPKNNKIYVPNQSNSIIAVIDGLSDTVVSNIQLSNRINGITYNSKNNKIYATEGSDNAKTYVIDGENDNIIKIIGNFTLALSATYNPINNKVYVANYGHWTTYLMYTVSVIDCNSDTVENSIYIGNEPEGIILNSINNKLYTGNWRNDTISVIDGSANSLTTTLAAGDGPHNGTFNPTNNKVYVTNRMTNKVSVIQQIYNQQGILTSPVFDTQQPSAFESLSWNATVPSEAGPDAVKLQIASNNDNSIWDFVGPDGTPNTYYMASGQSIWQGHNGNRYIRYKLFLSTANNKYTPILHDIKIVYKPYDIQPPVTTVGLSGTQGDNDWYKSDVQISLTATDSESGVAKTEYTFDNGNSWIDYTDPFTVSTEGNHQILYRSTDSAGNVEDEKSVPVNIDKFGPSIVILIPEQWDYQISDNVILNFLIIDDISGLASSTSTLDGQVVTNGQPIDLFKLPIGQHNFLVSTTDNAGNMSIKEIVFNTVATPDSLMRVVNELIVNGKIPPGIGRSLIAKLEAAQKSIEKGNDNSAKGEINSFINEVEAQAGKKIESETALLLIRAAQSIIIN